MTAMGFPQVPGPRRSAEDDADQAMSFAIGLDDASPERIAAVAAVLVNAWQADSGRFAAAAAVCRRRQGEGDDDVWGETANLLDRALGIVHDAGADNDDDARVRLLGKIFPDPGPFQWDTARRRDPVWWLRRLAALRVRAVHLPAGAPAGFQRLVLRRGPLVVGQIDFQVCQGCRRGYVRKISIDGAAKGYGIGTRAVLKLYRRYPGLTWYTTTQYDTAGTFWQKIARRTDGAFTENHDGACDHMKIDRRG